MQYLPLKYLIQSDRYLELSVLIDDDVNHLLSQLWGVRGTTLRY